MLEFKNFKTFLEKNKKKTIFSSIKSVHGLNFKSTKKIALLNGMDLKLSNKVPILRLEVFYNIKEQVNFFFNLEKNKIFNNVGRKKKIKSYTGMRHILRLPVRGQRTHTNAQTPRKNIKKEI